MITSTTFGLGLGGTRDDIVEASHWLLTNVEAFQASIELPSETDDMHFPDNASLSIVFYNHTDAAKFKLMFGGV